MAREYSLTTALLTAGIREVSRGKTLLEDLVARCPELDIPVLVESLGRVADPDLALLNLARVLEGTSGTSGGSGAADASATVGASVASGLPVAGDTVSRGAISDSRRKGTAESVEFRGIGTRALRLLGYSEFFGTYLAAHPGVIATLEDEPQPETFSHRLLEAVAARNLGDAENPCWVAGETADVLALRRAYYANLAQIAAADLARDNLASAKTQFEPTATAISALVDAALEATLALVRRDLDPYGEVAFTVIAMGKAGARELNYISDVDVIYVAEPRVFGGESGYGEGQPSSLATHQVLSRATDMAVALGSLCSATLEEPALWVLDTALRPEGKDGALVRGVESHREYYERWAKAWEFQALLKARPAAGDRALGVAYLAAIQPFVWQAVEHEGFVEETRAMRRRVEKLLDPKKAGREIKLGVGGLRDVEFTVQLLQLVHGRVDESLRVAATLEALRVLVSGGYIGRDQGEELANHYRFLRVLEHRAQLGRMRRTHLFPTGMELRRVAHSLDPERFVAELALKTEWETVRARVRTLHEEIYYRPLLPALAKLSAGEASLDREAAASRLKAIGYRDPLRALGHIEALTQGVTRRAAIQRQLLPVLLGWFADGVNPDDGLLAFRQVSEALGDTHWYLRLLRDSGTAAKRLTTLLSSSPLVAGLLPENPEAVAWLDDDVELALRSREELETEILASFERQADPGLCAQRLRDIRGRELLRCAIVDVLGGIDPLRVSLRLGAVGEAVLAGALDLALRRLGTGAGAVPASGAVSSGGDPGVHEVPVQGLATCGKYAQYLIVAMGRFGGGESGYPTDADVVFYYQPHDSNPEAVPAAAMEAQQIVAMIREILGGVELGSWVVDTDLRPEGKAGPAAKDLDTLGDYMARWAEIWERQALLRANPIVGSAELKIRFQEIINPFRYEQPPDEKEIKSIRRLKARMESERLGTQTFGVTRSRSVGSLASRQVKLGPGGLSDVEWVVQLLQLCFAKDHPTLRTTSTRQGLQAACAAGIVAPPDAQILDEAWLLASKIRAANVLGSGRTSGKKLDVVATDRLLVTTAALLGYPEGFQQDLLEDWMRTARLARAVVEKVFYE
ncbi:Glutamate-ammonia-ligase adenylyltransferase [Mobiluncus mulieris]|uniref:bifunctional [glutamine synthetase] adenylyltransferase/[glutamine synthetase]-adenylyl-L-tyrosine phosphorylase n=1 Tax=Mobiluncus mulieris TaxID=2052 RepID=UPI00019F94E7|nr:bifunctional [glutamine synthetase] adenylyltransferase/[glutamine synthetase]-adenylyl-L-tyrosine phosphorylase [Mobiluncus mulieris]EEJ54060.1 [glutamate--ammonia-ligase] adenylyltransferase [Mobiluncus mulieris ATCC 35243]SPX75688.1 Glutamate-ammonia-ligase adenylyltransferase [Mobiluncus mulieris]